MAALGTAALATRVIEPGFTWTLRIPVALLVVSAIAIHVRRLEAQVLTRALWFATALLGVSSLVLPLGVARGLSLGLVATAVGALALAGRRGLVGDSASGAFAPAAFRVPLLASVGMALVDAHALLFFGVACLERYDTVTLPLVLGGLLAAAAVGVYRLRSFAVLAMFGLNVVVLASAIAGALWVPPPLAVMLIVTSLVQLVLPLPMLRAIARQVRAAAAEHASRRGEGNTISATPATQARFGDPPADLRVDADRFEDEPAPTYARSLADR